MVYSDTTNKKGVLQVFERKTDLGYGTVTGDTTKLAEATAIANEKNHEIWSIIHRATGNWQYDDSNYTDLPIATTNLVSGQARYALPDEALTVQRIEVKDSNGDWYKLQAITKEEIGSGVDEYFDEAGTPRQYTLVNGTIELFPASNYNSANGLKVYYDRASSDFLTTDTTKTPGFCPVYHALLPIKMSIDWLQIKQPSSISLQYLLKDEAKLEKELIHFYGSRFKDKKPRIGRAYQSYK